VGIFEESLRDPVSLSSLVQRYVPGTLTEFFGRLVDVGELVPQRIEGTSAIGTSLIPSWRSTTW
jgi:hypothetical protein